MKIYTRIDNSFANFVGFFFNPFISSEPSTNCRVESKVDRTLRDIYLVSTYFVVLFQVH